MVCAHTETYKPIMYIVNVHMHKHAFTSVESAPLHPNQACAQTEASLSPARTWTLRSKLHTARAHTRTYLWVFHPWTPRGPEILRSGLEIRTGCASCITPVHIRGCQGVATCTKMYKEKNYIFDLINLFNHCFSNRRCGKSKVEPVICDQCILRPTFICDPNLMHHQYLHIKMHPCFPTTCH